MVKRLAGGNPQIPKGDGDAVVQQYIDACPEWKQDVVRRIDVLVTQTLPDVEKAVRWNSPFYGVGNGWMLNVHCYTRYVKVTFFRGAKLDPLPPMDFKDPQARAMHILDDGDFDEEQFIDWVRQAAAIPGWGGD